MQNTTETRKAPRRGRRVLMIVVSALLAVVLAAGGTAYALLRRGLPKIDGTLTVPGLIAAVTVTRDADGVPHIYAENEHDLYLAQGYVQAQDRLFQMDLSRRQASGRLSEVIGAQALDTDKYYRTLGLRRAAELSLPGYSDEALDKLQAFADGVNAFIDEHENSLSVEFLLNGYKPEPWTPVDTLCIGKYMAHDLGGHWRSQAFRQYLLDNFPEAEARELFPDSTYPDGAPLIIPTSERAGADDPSDGEDGDGGADTPAGTAARPNGTDGIAASASPGVADYFVSASVQQPDEWNGSNNWVVAGSKTASGQPLLANDPHLSIASPSVWYQMHLETPEINVSGVIFAGAPGIIVGHNDHIAWGVTNTSPDVQDLYIEKINPDNPHQYLYKGEWVDATIVNEDILIKGGDVEPFDVMVTRHGPVISTLAETGDEHTVYAMQWTALEATLEIQAVFDMNRATDWPSFEKALESFHAPTQNFVFASGDGTIAYKANGRIPIRAQGDGLLPVPGWTGEYEWIGYIPYDELPTLVNPASGFIASANHKVIDDSYPYHISHDWSQPYRQQRIVDVLSEGTALTADDMRALQGDVLDLHAEEILPIIRRAFSEQPLSERQAKAMTILDQWDIQTTEEQAAPLIFGLWFSRIGDVIFEDRFSDEGAALFTGRGYTVDGLLRNVDAGGASAWIGEKGGLTTVLLTALDRALDEIERTQGKDMSKWTWGKFHQVGFVHPLSSVSFLKPIFNAEGRKASPGTNTTVRAASWNASGLNNHGASWRFIRDFGAADYAWQIVAPGETGHPLSPYYHAQFDRWIAGEQYQTYVNGYDGNTLTLNPKK